MQAIQLANDGENPKTWTLINGGNVSTSTNAKENGEVMNLLKVCIHS